ncbi:transportin [Arachis hypogaea]|nr:transportin [Arachis hypogaea]
MERFITKAHQDHFYEVVAKKKVIPEVLFKLKKNEYPEIRREIRRRARIVIEGDISIEEDKPITKRRMEKTREPTHTPQQEHVELPQQEISEMPQVMHFPPQGYWEQLYTSLRELSSNIDQYFLAEIEELEQKSDLETEKGLQMLSGSDLRALEGAFLEPKTGVQRQPPTLFLEFNAHKGAAGVQHPKESPKPAFNAPKVYYLVDFTQAHPKHSPMTITLVLHGFRASPDPDSVEPKLEIAFRIPIEYLGNFGYLLLLGAPKKPSQSPPPLSATMEGGGATLSDVYQGAKKLLLNTRDGMERLERLDYSASSDLSFSLSNDISQIQSLCVQMDRFWRSIAAKSQRDLWKRKLGSVCWEKEGIEGGMLFSDPSMAKSIHHASYDNSDALNLLKKFHKGHPKVRTQISIAVAALAVHVPAEDWGDGGIVKWLRDEMDSHPEYIPGFLELLTVLPEVLEAFASWLRLKHGIPGSVLSTHPLVLTALSSLNSEFLSEASVNGVVGLTPE